jgi:nucleoside-diphosphate-sugar epimerase
MVNSKNADDLSSVTIDNLYIAAVPAVKWYANQNEIEDRRNIDKLLSSLSKISKANNVYLISTIDVYPDPFDVDEREPIQHLKCEPYGKNRYYFESEVKKLTNFNNIKILRLPGLFGEGLKKNLIYDFLEQKEYGESVAINSYFQFYDLSWLAEDINKIRYIDSELFNFAVEPVGVADVKRIILNRLDGVLKKNPITYNFKTIHSHHFGSNTGYMRDRETVLRRIEFFAKQWRKNEGTIILDDCVE